MSAAELPSAGDVASARKPIAPGEPLPRKQVLNLSRREGLEYFLYLPASLSGTTPVVVSVHGVSRNAEEHARLLSVYAESYGAILVVPFFSEAGFPDYQRLGRTGHGPRADLILGSILEEVGTLLGRRIGRCHLFGFSGGAQFVHRYAMAHPQRVERAVVAAAGWYTFPDGRIPYPYGTRSSRDLSGVRFDPEEYLQVPITVIVGDRDLAGEHMRTGKKVNRQGTTRVDRAVRWVTAMRAAAAAHRLEPRVVFEGIPGGEHVFAALVQDSGLGARAFAALLGPPGATRSERGGAARVDGGSHNGVAFGAHADTAAGDGDDHD